MLAHSVGPVNSLLQYRLNWAHRGCRKEFFAATWTGRRLGKSDLTKGLTSSWEDTSSEVKNVRILLPQSRRTATKMLKWVNHQASRQWAGCNQSSFSECSLELQNIRPGRHLKGSPKVSYHSPTSLSPLYLQLLDLIQSPIINVCG